MNIGVLCFTLHALIYSSQRVMAEEKKEVNQVEKPSKQQQKDLESQPKEINGRNGPEPTRFGDWEKNGRCIDF